MEASSFLWVLKNHYSLSKEADILGLKLPLKKFNSNPKLYKPSIKGTFLSEDTDVFVIPPYRQTFFFPETENLNFGDF